MRSIIPSLSVLLLWIASVVSTVPLWPLPSSVSVGTSGQLLSIASDFYFRTAVSNSVIDDTVNRYVSLINAGARKERRSAVNQISYCSVATTSNDVLPEIIGADGSYSIHISETGDCAITAANTWGVLHAIETFSQLLQRDSSSNGISLTVSAPVDIQDQSRYGHRGILMDSARHYQPISEIKRMIDTLPMNKFNVLHWHIIDAESFPFQSPSEPTMVNAAFSPSMIYTVDDLAAIKQYAYNRGVEILIEVDIPGHAAAWNVGKPEIMADCMEKYWYNINDFALDPTLDLTYSTVQGVLGDVIKALGTSRIHLGGDEVVYGCWKNDSSITNFMNTNGITTYDGLLSYFVQRVDGMVNGMGASVTHWEEVFTAGCKVPDNTIFQVWTDSSKMAALTSANYPVIASPSNYWYLDHAENTWDVMYNYDPSTNLTASQASKIVGGEAAMWAEHIDNLNIEQNVYPRACSVAERLWSPATVTDNTDALNRLIIQRCRMVNRGVNSAPVQPASYCSTVYV